MTSLAIQMLQGDALRRSIFQTRQLPSDDKIWRLKPCQCGCNGRDKNCHDKICPWILPRTIAILPASADRPKFSGHDRHIIELFSVSRETMIVQAGTCAWRTCRKVYSIAFTRNEYIDLPNCTPSKHNHDSEIIDKIFLKPSKE